MQREVLETGLRRARDARVALAALLVLSMAANLVLALGLAGRDLAAAFYPKRIAADPEGLAVDVEGELATWIGREESAREDKRYRLTFRLDAGRLGLVRFEQMENGK